MSKFNLFDLPAYGEVNPKQEIPAVIVEPVVVEPHGTSNPIVQMFSNPEFGEIRTLETDDGKVLFCGADIANALGYSNPRKALADHCRCVTKRDAPHPQSHDKTIEMSFIPEGDVYRLIAHSKLPNAEKFELWVFDEVLPTIRKHGAYMTPDTIEKVLQDPDLLIRLATELKNEREQRKHLETRVSVQKQQIETQAAQIAEYAPKADFADKMALAKKGKLIRDFCHTVSTKDRPVKESVVRKWLRDNGFLAQSRKCGDRITSKAERYGILVQFERPVEYHNGDVEIHYTAKLTGKGEEYLTARLDKIVGK